MLIKLLPEQVSKHWNDVKWAIEQSLPPIVGMQSDRMSNILTAILTEELVVWISVEKRTSENVITGLVVTSLLFDKPSGTKSLLIYCIYGYSNSTAESWKGGFETLRKYGVGKSCNRIIGYTDVNSIIKFAQGVGAETRYTLVSFPLGGD